MRGMKHSEGTMQHCMASDAIRYLYSGGDCLHHRACNVSGCLGGSLHVRSGLVDGFLNHWSHLGIGLQCPEMSGPLKMSLYSLSLPHGLLGFHVAAEACSLASQYCPVWAHSSIMPKEAGIE